MRSLKKRRLLFNLLLIASMIASYLPITLSNTVNAVSAEQRKIFNYTITYFNECGENSGGGSDISSDVADPNEAAAEIFKALTTHNFKHNGNKPLNAVQAAAVLGNLQSESGFNPNLDNGLGYHGLAQWGGGRWDAIPSPKGFKEQVEYLLEEMDNDYYGPALSEFWESSTPDDLAKATFAFVRNYEVAILNGGDMTQLVSIFRVGIHVHRWATLIRVGQMLKPSIIYTKTKFRQHLATSPLVVSPAKLFGLEIVALRACPLLLATGITYGLPRPAWGMIGL